MFIDFHTHVFPDAIAERAISSLKEKADRGVNRTNSMTAHTDGTLSGLKRSMELCGIDASLVLPVCTRPEQFDTVNKFASEINGRDAVYSFGGIHPDCENVEEKLDFIKSLGLRGVKMHPAYQGVFIDDARVVRIAEHCLKIGLYVTFHAGYDIAYPDTDYCSAEAFVRTFEPLLQKYGESREPHIILAHLGGIKSLDKTLDYLCGLPIYLDMANTLEQIPTDMLFKVIRSHGADKILFASDSPWQDQRVCRERLASLPISKEEFELISHKNATKILFG